MRSETPSEPALRATTVSAGYGARAVLHEISLTVAAGEMVAIVGPNGAGKSTLLRVLGGGLMPQAGTVELAGRALKEFDRRTLARMVAVVAQENLVAFRFSVLEIVLMGRAPHLGSFHLETRRDLEVAHAAMARFGLLPLARRSIQELSGGERKRVFLARALAQEPRIALLDEPTAFLDLRHIEEIFTCFRKLCREQALAVVTTLHDLNAAARHADRILLMKEGTVVAIGSAEEVLTEYNLRAVYETEIFIGRNPVTGGLIVLPGPPGSLNV